MALETLELTLPECWAAALINGDESGMDGGEVLAMNKALDEWHEVEGILRSPLSVSEEPFFARGHDARLHVLPATCLIYTFALVEVRE